MLSKLRNMLFYDTYKLIFYIGFILIFIGVIVLLNIYSSTSSLKNFFKHLIFIVIGYILIFLIKKFDFNKIKKQKNFLIIFLNFISISLLIYTIFISNPIKGAQRFIDLEIISFQPSELSKLISIFYFAVLFSVDIKNNKLKYICYIFGFIPIILIFIQPHVSSGMTICFTLLTMIIVQGISAKKLLLISLTLICALCFAIFFFPHVKNRLTTFTKLNFSQEKNLENIDIPVQSKEAIKAFSFGGFLGNWFKGRAKDQYLAEAPKDYVFCIIEDEFGIFSLIILFLYLILFLLGIYVSYHQKNDFLKYLGVGLISSITINALIHIGVNIGSLIPTGVTLPFISYGGSALILNMIMLGILLRLAKEISPK